MLLQECFCEIFFKALCIIFEIKQIKVGWSNLGVLPEQRKARPRGEQPSAGPCPGTRAAAVQTTSKEPAGGFFECTKVRSMLK